MITDQAYTSLTYIRFSFKIYENVMSLEEGMQERLLELRGISKSFPGVRALNKVEFDLYSGEVHVLLGENGAGKSTLVKIITGAFPRDEGEITIKGKSIEKLDVILAKELGIAAIYQELSLVPHLTVAQNIFLGREPCKYNFFGIIDWKSLNSQASRLLNEVWGINISPTLKIKDLGIAQRQILEIVRACFSSNADIIIMDEPTSALSKEETEELFSFIRKMKERGIGVIYISHKLEEIYEIGDRVTILRDGKNMGTFSVEETDINSIITLMTGRTLENKYPKRKKEGRSRGKEVFRVEGLKRNSKLRNISFSLREGEILGVTGLLGAGKTELARALFGVDPVDSGSFFVNGEIVDIRSPLDAINLGIGLLPEDRGLLGLILNLSVKDNITLPLIESISRNGIIDFAIQKNIAEEYVQKLMIKTPSIFQKVKNLSGGTQQKVCLAKWLASKARILIFDEPTRGIDVGAKVEIYNFINDLAEKGVGIIVFSSEIPEILNLSDRIIVLKEGKITKELLKEEANEETILYYATKGK